MSKERRFNAQMRRVEESRTIEGVAIVFNTLSEDLGGFREEIKPEAVSQELLDNSDIKFYYNHNGQNIPLARYRGRNVVKGHKTSSLSIEIRTDGVYFKFEAPKTAAGDELLEAIERGDVDSCSFCFAAEKSGFIVEKRGSENVRSIFAFVGLYDFSAVDDPAYLATDIMTRDLKSALEELTGEDREQRLSNFKNDLEKRNFKVELSTSNTFGNNYKGVRVEEIKNGWLTTTYEWGYDSAGKWYDKEEKEYSADDPSIDLNAYFLNLQLMSI